MPPLPHSQADGRRADPQPDGPQGLDLERVVREVLRRLSGGASGHRVGDADAGSVGNGGIQSDTSQAGAQPPPAQDSRRLVVPTRLVTLDALQGRLRDLREVVVRADAIVTPLVRDELKQRGIQVTRCDQATAANGPAVMVGYCGAVDPRVERVLSDCGARIENVWRGEERRVVPLVAQAVGHGRALGILVCGKVAVATCLANRYAGARAVVGLRRSLVEEAIAEMAANVLVLTPAGDDNAAAVEVFVRSGVRQCPTEWRALLELEAETSR